MHEGHRLLIVTVPPREPGMVWEDRGIAWSRAGDALVPLNDHQRRLIYLEAAPDFSAQVCTQATLADLDSAAIADFRSRWAARAQSDRISSLSAERTLIDAELAVDGKLTYAALILFGTRSALGRHLPQRKSFSNTALPTPRVLRKTARNTEKDFCVITTYCGTESICVTTSRATRMDFTVSTSRRSTRK
jgi:hypothetical protein